MIIHVLADITPHYEIIIIDDGSTDHTGDIARDLAQKREKIRVISHEKNRGKGAALISGIHHAQMDWILFTDADLQIDISELRAFLLHTDAYDFVAGFRLRRRDPFSRIVLSKIYGYLLRVLLGIRARDVNCPFKLIRTTKMRSLELSSHGFFIDAELMYHWLLQGYGIKELGVACQPRQRGRSTVRFRHVIETIKELGNTLLHARGKVVSR